MTHELPRKKGISFYLKKSLILKKNFKDFRKKTLILHYVPLHPSIPLPPYTHSNKHYHQVWQEQKRQKFSSTTICKPGSSTPWAIVKEDHSRAGGLVVEALSAHPREYGAR